MSRLDLFKLGDVYLDHPYEEVKFRYEKATNRVFARRYGKPEFEVRHSHANFNDAICSGVIITREQYEQDDVIGAE